LETGMGGELTGWSASFCRPSAKATQNQQASRDSPLQRGQATHRSFTALRNSNKRGHLLQSGREVTVHQTVCNHNQS
jgi:hypothetical protein